MDIEITTIQQREKEKAQIIDLWLTCKTQGEIANQMHISKTKVTVTVDNFKDENYDQIAENPPESLKMFN